MGKCEKSASSPVLAGACAEAACAAEMLFLRDMILISSSSGSADFDTLGHSNGFDHVNECKSGKNGDKIQRLSDRVCCGDSLLYRFPFEQQVGVRECCGEKTFDARVYECCSGDVVLPGTR